MKLHFVFTLAILIKYAGAQCIDTWPNSVSDPAAGNMTLCTSASCSGECVPDNGCSCTSDFSACLPDVTISCHDFDPTLCCPQGLYYHDNQSCCTTTPTCIANCATDEKCDLGKCVCDSSKYQNLTLKDFQPKVVCENNITSVTVSKCELQKLGYNTSDIHLRDSSENCSYLIADIINGLSVITVQSKTLSNWCGNILTFDDSYIYLNNTINIGILNTKIITINPISFNYTCGYKRDMQTSLKLPGNITTQTVELTGINGTGSYPLTMAAYKDLANAIPFTNNDEVPVGSDIYIGLFVTGVDGNTYVLRVETCYASPTDDRNDTNAFPLIVDSCPTETVSTTILENGMSLQARFRISSFLFQNQPYVYIFCDARLCVNSTGTCSKCIGAKSFNTDTNEVSIGLNIAAKYDYIDNAGTYTAAPWTLLATIQLAFVFIKFF